MIKILSKRRYLELSSYEDLLNYNDKKMIEINKELNLLKPDNEFFNKLLAWMLNNPQYQIYKLFEKRNIDADETLNANTVFIIQKDETTNLNKEWFDEKREAELKNPGIIFPDKERELGDICLYALSRDMTENDDSIMIHEFKKYPFLDASLSIKGNLITVFINNLHSRCSNNDFRENGYGTLLINCLLEILESNPLYSFLGINIIIKGDLSKEDIECEQDIEIRNSFYRNKGFNLDFKTKDEKNGTFDANLIDLINVKLKHTYNQGV